ncbi:MAG: replicative DNA helicase [Solobacterium sp.]|nr:replicative DNA helicase [Solobacterium sp.]
MARVLPSAPEAEATLLGNMMVYPSAARIAMEEGLSEEDFFVEANRRIFLAIDSLYKQGERIDLTTVVTRLKDMDMLDKCGGVSYLSDLSDASVTSANVKSYVNMVHDKAVVRKMIEAAETLADEGYSGQTDINEYLDACEKAVLEISRNRRTNEFRTSPELITGVLENIQKMSDNRTDITGLKTGFNDFDHTLHGLQKGDLIVLAARPAMGKTAVALNMAMNVAAYQPRGAVAIFSLEMAAEQLAMRLLSAKSHIPGDKLRTGRLTDADWNRLNEAAGELKMSNIYIDDTSMIKVPEIFSKCRRLKADVGLNLVLIDYIQLITASGNRRNENRQQEISDISRNLKALARELEVPVIALSQLSRSVEQRDNKHPMLSDLRESGAIEQDADIVLMLYREAYYDEAIREQAQKDGNERLEINIAKHRNGATRKVYLAFENTTNALYNIASEQ